MKYILHFSLVLVILLLTQSCTTSDINNTKSKNDKLVTIIYHDIYYFSVYINYTGDNIENIVHKSYINDSGKYSEKMQSIKYDNNKLLNWPSFVKFDYILKLDYQNETISFNKNSIKFEEAKYKNGYLLTEETYKSISTNNVLFSISCYYNIYENMLKNEILFFNTNDFEKIDLINKNIRIYKNNDTIIGKVEIVNNFEVIEVYEYIDKIFKKRITIELPNFQFKKIKFIM